MSSACFIVQPFYKRSAQKGQSKQHCMCIKENKTIHRRAFCATHRLFSYPQLMYKSKILLSWVKILLSSYIILVFCHKSRNFELRRKKPLSLHQIGLSYLQSIKQVVMNFLPMALFTPAFKLCSMQVNKLKSQEQKQYIVIVSKLLISVTTMIIYDMKIFCTTLTRNFIMRIECCLLVEVERNFPTDF